MKRITVILLVIIFMLGVSGCMGNQDVNELQELFGQLIQNSTEKDIETAQNALSLKYGCEFTVTHIGGRIDSDSTTMYLTPDFDENLVVRAELYQDSQQVRDNLIDRLVGRSFSKTLDDMLKEKDVDISAWTSFVCSDRDQEEDDINITVDEFTDKYHPEQAMVYFALRQGSIDGSTAAKLTGAFSDMSKKYKVEIILHGVILDEDYAECAAQIKDQTILTATWFYDFKTTDAFRYAVTEGESNLSDSELQAILNGE